jgi:hypothetical protein
MKPLLQLFDLSLAATNLLQCVQRVSLRLQLRGGVDCFALGRRACHLCLIRCLGLIPLPSFEFLCAILNRALLLFHLLRQLLVDFAPFAVGAYSCGDEIRKLILGESFEVVLLNGFQLGGTRVIA